MPAGYSWDTFVLTAFSQALRLHFTTFVLAYTGQIDCHFLLLLHCERSYASIHAHSCRPHIQTVLYSVNALFFIWYPHSHADGCISSNLWFGVSLRTFRLEEPGIEPPVFRLVDIGHYDIEPSSVVRIQETKPFLILRLGFKLSSLMKLIVS